ncbi:S8 family serine peptidase [Acholeplasma laidlawii]|uniref:S8 family serine peptidase n=1 Tax=Acholeplasma laidlawii TaxID=2148 RepID=UPI0018C24CAB|nr:S8 family serine peptidase [Acholeplasma laidlawii]MBG0762723.1 S8 family serine peptidase [Acholeplasma laidlawii]
MKRYAMKKYLLITWTLIMSVIFIACTTGEKAIEHEPSINKIDYNLPSDQHFDAEGNLRVPFDIAYKDYFDSGLANYDDQTVLVKFDVAFDGTLTRNLKNAGIESLEQMMQGADDVWYVAHIKRDYTIKNVMSSLRALNEVLVADYNYVYQTEDFDPTIIPNVDVSENPQSNQQWYLNASGIQDAWKWLEHSNIDPGGLPSVVVAVIDTGVDYNHIDLRANMWTNTKEIPGNGIDDDGNGYVDDIHGVNVVSNEQFHSGNPMDDHGHGTHVAGIIAASNNKEGIVGIAHNVQIMAIKAGMSSGYFTQDSIAKAILYAYDNGADVINMSFGGGAVSIAVQDALMTAYSRAVLVASAGNNGLPNELTDFYLPAPNYPAALSYVIGVMSVGSTGVESSFSNWDARAFNAVEYEVYAPGEQMLSTLPNDQYATWSGTSMAAPVVSAIAALLRSVYDDRDMYSNKFIMGQLTSTSETYAICNNPQRHTVGGGLHNIPPIIDAYKALTKLPKPEINLYNYYIFDAQGIAEENNGDGIIDAGETIDIGLVLRNRWGMSKETIVSMDTLTIGGVESEFVEFITKDIDFGQIGTYSTKDTLSKDGSIVTGVETPFRIKVAENTPNDYIIKVNVSGTYLNGLDTLDETIYTFNGVIEIKVRNGFILPNIISEDMTLTKDKYYIIPNSMVIQENATVTVEPGTNIQFWSNDPQDAYAESAIVYLRVEGKFITLGTQEEPVKLFPSALRDSYRVEIYETGSKGYVSLTHTHVTNGHLTISYAEHSKFNQNYISNLAYRYLESGQVQTSTWGTTSINIRYAENNIFYAIGGSYKPVLTGTFINNIFVNSGINFQGEYIGNVFLGNNTSIYGPQTNSNAHLSRFGRLESITSQFYNPITGKTYLALKFDTPIYQQTAVRLAESLGGKLLQIETEEEYNLLKNQIYTDTRDIFIGIKRDFENNKYQWLDGSDIGSFMPIDHLSKSPYYGYRYNFDNFTPMSQIGYGFVVEIEGDIYTQQILLDNTSIDIDMESSYLINSVLVPTTANPDDLIYVSSDEGVVTVDENGLVEPVSYGQAVVYIYSNDYQVSNQLIINVLEKVALESIDASISNTQMNINTTSKINIQLLPSNTTERIINYSSSNPEVVSVDHRGNLNAKTVGEVVITASNQDGAIFDEVVIHVVSPVTSVKFEESIYMTTLTQTDEDFYPLVLPLDATNRNLTWESSNPEVAYVDESGVLVKLKEGVATLVATVENTNLKAEVIVSIKGDQTSGYVLKMVERNNQMLALYSDGNIYYWGKDILSPKILPLTTDEFIIDFATMNSSYLFALTNDGTVLEFYIWSFFNNSGTSPINLRNNYQTQTLQNIVQISGNQNYGSTHALRSDGSVWAWGNNEQGQLGDGTKTSRNSPVQVMIDDVKQVITGSGYTMFLQNTGDLYATGGSPGYMVPTQINQNIETIDSLYNNEYVVARSTSTTYSYNESYTSNVATMNTTNKAYLDGYDNNLYIEDGYVWNKGYDYFGKYGLGYFPNAMGEGSYVSSFQKTVKIANVKEIFVFYQNTYYQTEDGKFYGSGSNSNLQLANFNNQPSATPVRIFFDLEGNEGGFSLESINITDEKLYANSIILDFNEAMIIGDNYVYMSLKDSQNNTLAITRHIHLDKLTITPFSSWTIGETYTLTIPANSLLTKFMTGNEALNYTFIYQGEQTAISLISQSIQNNHDFVKQDIQIDLLYTYAAEGISFDDIGIFDQNNERVLDVSITLNHNKLSILGTLAFGSYELRLPSGALKDNIGGINEEVIISFNVLKTLLLEGITHIDGSERIMVDEPIVLTFNVALPHETFNQIALLNDANESIEVVVTLIDNVLTITPSNSLDMNKVYQLNVPANALIDELGNTNDVITSTFKTYAPIELIRTSINNGQSNIHPTQTIIYFFNHIEAGDFFTDIQLLNHENQIIPANITITDHKQLEIKSVTPLLFGNEYRILIPAGALKDELGVINEAIETNFSTVTKQTRFFWDYSNVLPYWQELVDKGHNTNFYGNAILNNFNNTNVEQWFRFQAESSGNYHRSTGIGGNYWGTQNQMIIDKHIIDFDDFQSLIDVIEGEILSIAPENTFPFVVDISLFNALGNKVTTVGNETVTFVVTFNRDMDITQDLNLTFGSYLPFADYQITGSYVTPRVWMGVYTLNTIIENGNQFFTIKQGAAADNPFLTLQPDFGRFTFQIDTTEAQAMIMQGVATITGIELNWEQDDFDTLAGYNVYRSTSEHGFYQRLNSSVIPYSTKTFFDETVEPGVLYYYNFTVVKTDLTESEPSGKIQIMSLDTMEPNIYHTPIYTAFTQSNLVITATIVDNVQVQDAKVFYRMVGEESWYQVTMTKNNNRYSAVIASTYITLDGLEYYIRASDGINYTYKGSEQEPFVITVQQTVAPSSKGDVNGDGVITTLDSLMVLQAINDRLNLTQEQFLRADLDGNGTLETWEVLKILQYVSGKITSLS